MKSQTSKTPRNLEATRNRQIILASRPNGEPSEENFKLTETEIPKPGSDQMLLRTIIRVNPEPA
jgi:NADPH-dependent curcumin reductase CurA